MATQVKHRRGTNAEILAGTPAIAEIWFNTTDNSIHMGDGVTQGGVKFRNALFANSLTYIKELKPQTSAPVMLSIDGRVSVYLFDPSDLSNEVASDPEEYIYIAPDSDPTGSSGAYVVVKKEYESLGTDISARKLSKNISEASQSDTVVKLCTWNIWGGSARQNYGDGSFANRDYLMEVKKNVLKLGAEYVGFQETYTNPTSDSDDYGIYPLTNTYFGLANDFGTNRLYGNITTSSRVIIDSSNTVFLDPPGGGDNEFRAYTRVVIVVGGASVAVYNTHLSFVTSRAQAMIQELVTAIQSEPEGRVIIMGDFNVPYTELLDFETEGFTIANKDEFNTNNKGGTWYIDNILYKGFSSLIDKNTMEVPEEVADHKPFFVELTL